MEDEKDMQFFIGEGVIGLFFGTDTTTKAINSVANYSMIKSMFKKYFKLITLLKRNGKGSTPKKAAIFTSTHISDFLNNAPGEVYLLAKVFVVFGIAGACRICEISQATLDDIEDSGTLLIVKLNQTKNDVNRRFVVTE